MFDHAALRCHCCVFVLFVAGVADEVSHGDRVGFLCGLQNPPNRQILQTHQGTEDRDGFDPSNPALPISAAFAGLKEGTLCIFHLSYGLN